MKYFKMFIAFIFVFSIIFPLHAEIGNIAVTIMDEEEFTPVSNAQIQVSDIGTKYTNFYGRSLFESIKKGPYYFSVRHPAYETHEKIYFIVDEWKEIQIYLKRSVLQPSADEAVSRIPPGRKDVETASMLRKFGHSMPVSPIPDTRQINSISSHLNNDPASKLFLESEYYSSGFQSRPREVDLGDSIDLINHLNNYQSSSGPREQGNIEYVLGQPLKAGEVDLNQLLYKKKAVARPHRDVGILTVVAGDTESKPLKGIPVAVYSVKSGKLLGEKNTDSFGRVIFYEIPKINVRVLAGNTEKVIPIVNTYTLCDFTLQKAKAINDSGLDLMNLENPPVQPAPSSGDAIETPVLTAEKTPENAAVNTPETVIPAQVTETPEKPAVKNLDAEKSSVTSIVHDDLNNEWVEINTRRGPEVLTDESVGETITIDKKKKFKW